MSELVDTDFSFSISPNPLKVVLLFEEILEELKKKFTIEREMIEQKQEKVITLCKRFIEKSGGKSVLLKLLKDKDLQGRTVFQLIRKQHTLLPKIESLVDGEWTVGFEPFHFQNFTVSTMFVLTVLTFPRPKEYLKFMENRWIR